jgi:hypothetical protein
MCGLIDIFFNACFGHVYLYISEKIRAFSSEEETLSLLDRNCENTDIQPEGLASGFDTAFALGKFISDTRDTSNLRFF